MDCGKSAVRGNLSLCNFEYTEENGACPYSQAKEIQQKGKEGVICDARCSKTFRTLGILDIHNPKVRPSSQFLVELGRISQSPDTPSLLITSTQAACLGISHRARHPHQASHDVGARGSAQRSMQRGSLTFRCPSATGNVTVPCAALLSMIFPTGMTNSSYRGS